MGFSCCFTGDKKQAQLDADTRHARIVTIYRTSNESQTINPPTYNEVVSNAGDISGRPLILVDEKEPTHTEPSRTPSPRTSIISVPSTRLTNLTASHTGASSTTSTVVAEDEGRRLSSMYGSPPPSYYAGSTCYESSIRTSTPELSQSMQLEHPVMSPDWFDTLRRDAERVRRCHNSPTDR